LVSFYERISTPVLTDIEVEFDGLSVSDLLPVTIPDLFLGSRLMLTGRFRASDPAVTVRVRGRVGGQSRQYEYNFEIDQDGNNDFVPRLWATRQIGLLLDEIRVKGETNRRVEKIRELGLAYGLVTPYTTFIIAPQAAGAASQANMVLYDDMTHLNHASGATTIQARVQNQVYQQTDQATLAVGANVMNSGQNSLAQVSNMNVDLALLNDYTHPNMPISEEWLAENISVDRYVEFGSEEYIELAQDPEVRTYLQTGANVIFEQDGDVISVQTGDVVKYETVEPYSPTILEKILAFFLALFQGE
jgi:Ca-activated chloride channel family protein